MDRALDCDSFQSLQICNWLAPARMGLLFGWGTRSARARCLYTWPSVALALGLSQLTLKPSEHK